MSRASRASRNLVTQCGVYLRLVATWRQHSLAARASLVCISAARASPVPCQTLTRTERDKNRKGTMPFNALNVVILFFLITESQFCQLDAVEQSAVSIMQVLAICIKRKNIAVCNLPSVIVVLRGVL